MIKTLYRPVNQNELILIEKSMWENFHQDFLINQYSILL